MPLNLSGSICALITPFRATAGMAGRDEPDLAAFARLIDSQIAGGTAAVVVAGSTGEAAALDDDEFSALLEFAVSHVAGRIPVLAGTGQQSTQKTIAQTRRALAAGADAALVACPAYVRPTQEGLFRHFCEVAEHGQLPVILYNVPSRTACDLASATTARLVGHGNIGGIKEANTEPGRMSALLELGSADFRILSGDDPTCMHAMFDGADGVVSVAANVAPAALSALCALARRGQVDEAGRLDASLRPLYELLGIEPNPIPVKWCAARIGIGNAQLRLPLLPLSPAYHARASAILAELGLVATTVAAGT